MEKSQVQTTPIVVQASPARAPSVLHGHVDVPGPDRVVFRVMFPANGMISNGIIRAHVEGKATCRIVLTSLDVCFPLVDGVTHDPTTNRVVAGDAMVILVDGKAKDIWVSLLYHMEV